MSYNAGKKTYTAVCQEKELFHQRVEKKKNSYTNQITHTPLQKTNGRPLN